MFSLAVAAAAIEKVTGKRAPTNQRRTNGGESATEDRAYTSVSKEEQVAKGHCAAAVHLKAELDDSRRLQQEVRRKRRAAEKAGASTVAKVKLCIGKDGQDSEDAAAAVALTGGPREIQSAQMDYHQTIDASVAVVVTATTAAVATQPAREASVSQEPTGATAVAPTYIADETADVK
jgi:hypothetical protein